MLVQRYSSSCLTEEHLLQCLYSISDNNSFLLFNRDPVDRMIAYLKHFFRPNEVEPGFSLGISGGYEGARLTHNHQRQYNYALQSLTLWREISHDMFKLWCLAESDLLGEGNSYRLQNTGQVQATALLLKQLCKYCICMIGKGRACQESQFEDHCPEHRPVKEHPSSTYMLN